jgi:hypothetical protein
VHTDTYAVGPACLHAHTPVLQDAAMPVHMQHCTGRGADCIQVCHRVVWSPTCSVVLVGVGGSEDGFLVAVMPDLEGPVPDAEQHVVEERRLLQGYNSARVRHRLPPVAPAPKQAGEWSGALLWGGSL